MADEDLTDKSTLFVPPQLAKKFENRVFDFAGKEFRPNSSEGRSIRKGLDFNTRGIPALDDQLIAALCDAIRAGCTISNAARVCSLPFPRLEKWILQGKDDIENEVESLKAKLVLNLNTAMGDAEAELSKVVYKQCKDDPRLALEVLSRRNPEHWAPAVAQPEDTRNLYKDATKEELLTEVRRLLNAKEEK